MNYDTARGWCLELGSVLQPVCQAIGKPVCGTPCAALERQVATREWKRSPDLMVSGDSFRAMVHERELREQWQALHSKQHEEEQGTVTVVFDAQKAAVDAALAAADRAVLKAETAAEKRFEGVNEFRASLADQQRTLMPRNEAELQFAALGTALKSLELRLAKVEGAKAGGRETGALYLSIGVLIVSAIGIVIALFVK